jgi:hypothetical protein
MNINAASELITLEQYLIKNNNKSYTLTMNEKSQTPFSMINRPHEQEQRVINNDTMLRGMGSAYSTHHRKTEVELNEFDRPVLDIEKIRKRHK